MTIEEQYAPVTHKHLDCPICNDVALIQDVQPPRSSWDWLILAIRNNNAKFRIMQGKRIEIKEVK